MDINYVFYKELSLFDENIFSANLAENKEIEEIRLNLDNQHLITSLKVNQKSEKLKLVTNFYQMLLLESHKKLKMFLLGVTWKWKMYFFHRVNLKKKTM